MDPGPVRPARWFLLRGDEQVGPLMLDEMRRRVLDGTVTPETWVWADGMPDWMPARRVPALVPPRHLSAPGGWPAGAGPR